MNPEPTLRAREYLSGAGVWPKIPAEMRPAQWLSNFADDDADAALALLQGFSYYSAASVHRMLATAFTEISSAFEPSQDYNSRVIAWRQYLGEVLVSFPTGEEENPSDSGHRFVRAVRDTFDIPESNILSPDRLIERLLAVGPRPVVLVDDFAGSGNQFFETWNRVYTLDSGARETLARVCEKLSVGVNYVCALATWKVHDRLLRESPTVVLRCGNLLPSHASILSPECSLIEPSMRKRVLELIDRTSQRIEFDVKPYVGPYGFQRIGLSVALGTGRPPDATLPMFWARSKDPGVRWTRLIKEAS